MPKFHLQISIIQHNLKLKKPQEYADHDNKVNMKCQKYIKHFSNRCPYGID